MVAVNSDFFTPDLPADTLYHVGISGGKDSTAVLLWLIHESGIPRDKINATFCDTDNEHDWTHAHIQMLSEKVHPIETLKPDLGFYELAMKKKLFPSTKKRFCTEFLKIVPTHNHISKLLKEHAKVIAVSGTRADESELRKRHLEWDYSGRLMTLSWRPLIRWTLDDVFAIHKKYDIPLNPLYAMGATRVGCFPCIMSNKAEIRMIALKFPERIDAIRKAELLFEQKYGRYSSFFKRKTVPRRFWSRSYSDASGQRMEPDPSGAVDSDGSPVMIPMMIATIDDVVRWAMTGDRAKGSYLDEPEKEHKCQSGFCE